METANPPHQILLAHRANWPRLLPFVDTSQAEAMATGSEAHRQPVRLEERPSLVADGTRHFSKFSYGHDKCGMLEDYIGIFKSRNSHNWIWRNSRISWRSHTWI